VQEEQQATAERLNALGSDLARTREQQRNLQSLAERLQADKQRAESELAGLLAEQQNDTRRLDEAAKAAESAVAQSEALRAERSALCQALEADSAGLQQLREHISALAGQTGELEQQRQQLDERLHGLRMAENETAIKMRDMLDRIAEDYGVRLEPLVAGPAAYYLIRLLGKSMHKASRKALESWSSLLAVLEETLTGIRVVKFDAGNFEACQHAVERIAADAGPIEILVNNAGITRDQLVMRMKRADWDSVLNTNLTSAYLGIQQVIGSMLKQRWGRIINITSVFGQMGQAGQANYAASKGGLIAFTKTVAKELASRNVRANAIAPGFIQTEMTAKLSDEVKGEMLKFVPLGKFGTVRDVADLALFLVSDDSSYITGQVIQVDGGMVM
jgi:3-oxoacyl-[acyl-carrier protein] reductase